MAKLAPLEEALLNGESCVSNSSDPCKTKGNKSLTCYSNAGFFSILSFSWISPLIHLGNVKTLDHEDLPMLAADDSAYGAFTTFRNKLESECGSARRVTTLKLVKVLIFSTWQRTLLSGLLAFLCTCASYVGPYLIKILVQYFNKEHKFKNEGYMLAMAFVAAKLVECLSQRHWIFNLQQVGVRMQSMLVTMIYAKGLTLSCQSKEGYSSGEIINLITVDAERVGDLCWYMHAPWICILQVALAMLILYRSVGVASIAAFAATVIVMLLNLPLASLQEQFQGKIMEFKDKRMKATSEILKNMKILKLQAWEMKFLSKIFQLRKTEETWLKKFLVSTAITRFLLFNAPTFIAVVTFSSCVLIGIPLESGKILSALATFEILEMPIYTLPDTISMIIQTKVSLDRISSFLCLDELQTDVVEKLPRGSFNIAIELVDGNFSWELSSLNTTLKNINLRVFHGTRVAVCGTVGSGKSSLLSCIMGEIPKVSGTLKVCGSKAYVSQSPWIQSGTIENNILFGKEMDREKYEKVLEACSLTKDLEVLPFGDQTIIGEKGINLSGGQKQRVQIARALYQDSDIYLFDDPFSAVDAHTGSHLFRECLLGLLKTKTVIYITHQVEFLPDADLILASADQNTIDISISDLVWEITFSLIHLLGNIAVMSQAAWQVFIVLIPIMAACIWYQQYYSASARELARLVGICQAPVIQHFSETISGSTTIRCFEQQSRFNDIHMKLIDRYSQPRLNSASAMEWLSFRLDILSTITFAFCLVFLISFPNSITAPGIAGLAVTYGLSLNELQFSLIWCLCNLENEIISVERVLQYTSIPSEAPLVIKENQPDHSWPSFGEVHIQDLQVRYAPHLPLVLHGLTCTFTAGAKTGIAGRTGSGKSTLVLTLFRLLEPVAGQILIDGVNISLIGIHDLRSRLSIIPQDPTMFEGTIRSNLDPLEEYTDEQIWKVLDMCQLGDEVRKKEGKLDSVVTENGENWSMGQRQLVCLGRVLLKKSKILVLDEATASVDTATDNIIQQTVSQHFSECTVITIAHRITSILDSDTVLFLNQGLVEEYDSPKKLLMDKSSSLAQLVAEYTRRSNSGFGS
ncbi:ABC transporter C family member 3-like isoform X3 [Cajanus cajan]|uniref:ABC transporter C family member 3-like isoform X3 n=1 Tax=Cajanus cajan TaxID=3821 RepID=UPI0010FB232F|nr:ABC transporter C family member 3-like isoform X3 [Cajanus cajan]